MPYPEAARICPELVDLDHTGSTNDVLAGLVRDRVAAGRPPRPLTTVVTLDQRAGHGRLDRGWTTPRGRALAVSTLLAVPADRLAALPWASLVSGLACRRALAAAGVEATIKWPNDLLVSGAKITGILARLVTARPVDGALPLVVGFGINLAQTEADLAAAGLPAGRATSVALAGGDPDPDRLLAALLGELDALWTRAVADPAGLAAVTAAVAASCDTIGRAVRVELPDGAALHGTAIGLCRDGRLRVRDVAGDVHELAAGDVTHVRAADR